MFCSFLFPSRLSQTEAKRSMEASIAEAARCAGALTAAQQQRAKDNEELAQREKALEKARDELAALQDRRTAKANEYNAIVRNIRDVLRPKQKQLDETCERLKARVRRSLFPLCGCLVLAQRNRVSVGSLLCTHSLPSSHVSCPL